jgi:hypothetical protein
MVSSKAGELRENEEGLKEYCFIRRIPWIEDALRSNRQFRTAAALQATPDLR